jgi:hypothetical protein
VVIDTSKHTVDEAVEHILGQLVAQRMLDPAVAALKGRPKVQARAAPAKRVEAPKAAEKPAKPNLVKLPAPRQAAKPVKARRSAPARKTAAARTARAERPRMAAGGKRKR